MRNSLMVYFLIAVSIFGLAVPLVVVSSRERAASQSSEEMVGVAFATICVLGVVATRFPARCSSLAGVRSPGVQDGKEATGRSQAGHHASCPGFEAHVFQAFGTRLCLGCTGLLIGGVVALSLSILYFFFGLAVWGDDVLAVCTGVVLVGLALVHFSMLGTPSRPIRLAINALFPVGAFLILAALDRRFSSTELDALLLGTIVFWIVTRIYLSIRNHSNVCARCTLVVCPRDRTVEENSAPGS